MARAKVPAPSPSVAVILNAKATTDFYLLKAGRGEAASASDALGSAQVELQLVGGAPEMWVVIGQNPEDRAH